MIVKCVFYSVLLLISDGEFAIRIISQHLIDYISYLLLQLVDKRGSIILLVLYIAKLLLPQTSELRRLEQFLVYEVDEFYASRCGNPRLRSLRI